jgi:hypothetical protein
MILVWSSALVLLAVGVIGAAVALWLKLSKENSENAQREQSSASPLKTRVTSRFESPSEESALTLVKQALLVRDPAVIPNYFRLGTTNPGVVVNFLEAMAKNDGPITGYTWLSSMDRNGLLIDGVAVREEGGNSPKNRLAMLTPDENGNWKVDYDAFARTCKPPWNSAIKGKYQGGLVRVFIAKDSYYNSVFANDLEWTCYRLTSPDSEEVLLGYSRKNTPQSSAIIRIIENSNASGENSIATRAVLEIAHEEGAEPRQIRITRVMAEDWVLSATSFDERFK